MTRPLSSDVILTKLDDTTILLENAQFLRLLQQTTESISQAGVKMHVKLFDKWWEYIGTQEGDKYYRESTSQPSS